MNEEKKKAPIKAIFGMVKMGEKGQIVIPKEARDMFGYKPGDMLLILGDSEQGIAIPTKEAVGKFHDILSGQVKYPLVEDKKAVDDAEKKVADDAKKKADDAKKKTVDDAEKKEKL